MIHWRKVSSYSGNGTKEKKKIPSKYVWACSYFFFFFLSLSCYIPLFIFFSFFLSFTFSCLLKIITGVILKFLIQSFVIWFYHFITKTMQSRNLLQILELELCHADAMFSYSIITLESVALNLIYSLNELFWRGNLTAQ